MSHLAAMSSDVLRAIRDLCPDGVKVRSTTFTAGGRSVRLTTQMRERIDDELRRRRQAQGKSKQPGAQA